MIFRLLAEGVLETRPLLLYCSEPAEGKNNQRRVPEMKSSLKLALMLLGLLAGFLPVCGPLHSQDAAKPEGDAAEPSFKDEKYKVSFNQGKEEFKAGDYRGAGKSFKSALRGAAEKADKALVNRGILACKGSPTLKKIELMRQRNLWNEAYDQLLLALSLIHI